MWSSGEIPINITRNTLRASRSSVPAEPRHQVLRGFIVICACWENSDGQWAQASGLPRRDGGQHATCAYGAASILACHEGHVGMWRSDHLPRGIKTLPGLAANPPGTRSYANGRVRPTSGGRSCFVEAIATDDENERSKKP